jgi:hypothetical protein
MLIGNPLRFAVEIYHEPHSPEWLRFGRMCLHVAGATMGDLAEEHCSLFHAVERICELGKTVDSLWDERLSGHTDAEIFAWLDHELYTGESAATSSSNLAQFDFLTNTGEQFDASKSFIYCRPGGAVHILFDGRDGIFNSVVCESSEFRRQALDLEVWFSQQTKSGAQRLQ